MNNNSLIMEISKSLLREITTQIFKTWIQCKVLELMKKSNLKIYFKDLSVALINSQSKYLIIQVTLCLYLDQMN